MGRPLLAVPLQTRTMSREVGTLAKGYGELSTSSTSGIIQKQHFISCPERNNSQRNTSFLQFLIENVDKFASSLEEVTMDLWAFLRDEKSSQTEIQLTLEILDKHSVRPSNVVSKSFFFDNRVASWKKPIGTFQELVMRVIRSN